MKKVVVFIGSLLLGLAMFIFISIPQATPNCLALSVEEASAQGILCEESPTPQNTNTPEDTATAVPTETPNPTATASPLPSATSTTEPTVTKESTTTPTFTKSPTPVTPTETRVVISTIEATRTSTPTTTPTPVVVVTPTPTPVVTTQTPTPEPTPTSPPAEETPVPTPTEEVKIPVTLPETGASAQINEPNEDWEVIGSITIYSGDKVYLVDDIYKARFTLGYVDGIYSAIPQVPSDGFAYDGNGHIYGHLITKSRFLNPKVGYTVIFILYGASHTMVIDNVAKTAGFNGSMEPNSPNNFELVTCWWDDVADDFGGNIFYRLK